MIGGGGGEEFVSDGVPEKCRSGLQLRHLRPSFSLMLSALLGLHAVCLFSPGLASHINKDLPMPYIPGSGLGVNSSLLQVVHDGDSNGMNGLLRSLRVLVLWLSG